MRIATLTVVAGVILFVAGVAAAGVDLRNVILKPGQCVKVSKLRVCAAKAKPPITVTQPGVTVTTPAPPAVTTTVSTPPVTVTVTTTPTPKVAFGDGTYRIGPDIQPGTYQGVTTGDSCYWERLTGFGGTLAEIIANYLGTSPTIVTISSTDVGFRSSRCGNWTKIG